jgi:hypothetical protein
MDYLSSSTGLMNCWFIAAVVLDAGDFQLLV